MDLLKGVKYIFQIPLEWFRRVDARVFGDHPGPGVRFDDAMDGSRSIGIDYHVLDDRYGGSGGAERPETTPSLVDSRDVHVEKVLSIALPVVRILHRSLEPHRLARGVVVAVARI